jgi:hypothetical protein
LEFKEVREKKPVIPIQGFVFLLTFSLKQPE